MCAHSAHRFFTHIDFLWPGEAQGGEPNHPPGRPKPIPERLMNGGGSPGTPGDPRADFWQFFHWIKKKSIKNRPRNFLNIWPRGPPPVYEPFRSSVCANSPWATKFTRFQFLRFSIYSGTAHKRGGSPGPNIQKIPGSIFYRFFTKNQINYSKRGTPYVHLFRFSATFSVLIVFATFSLWHSCV